MIQFGMIPLAPSDNYEYIFRMLQQTAARFLPVSGIELEKTKNHYQCHSIPAKTIIHHQDEVFNYVLFLGKGLIRSYYLTPEGKDITYFFFRETDFVCDFESFLLQQPGNYYFETLEPCEYIRISYESVQALYRSSPMIHQFGRNLAEQAYLKVEQRLRMFMTQDLELKYRTLREREPDLPGRVHQHYLASYLGVSAEALSRLRSKEKRKKTLI